MCVCVCACVFVCVCVCVCVACDQTSLDVMKLLVRRVRINVIVVIDELSTLNTLREDTHGMNLMIGCTRDEG